MRAPAFLPEPFWFAQAPVYNTAFGGSLAYAAVNYHVGDGVDVGIGQLDSVLEAENVLGEEGVLEIDIDVRALAVGGDGDLGASCVL